MKLLFYRKYSFQVRIQNQAQQFFAELGFFSPLNPETGMSANLPEIDQTFSQFILANQEFDDLKLLLESLRNYFSSHVTDSELLKIRIQGLDGVSVHWDHGVCNYSELFVFKNLFQIEIASQDLKHIRKIKNGLNLESTESAEQLLKFLKIQSDLSWVLLIDPAGDISYLHTQSL